MPGMATSSIPGVAPEPLTGTCVRIYPPPGSRCVARVAEVLGISDGLVVVRDVRSNEEYELTARQWRTRARPEPAGGANVLRDRADDGVVMALGAVAAGLGLLWGANTLRNAAR